VLIDMYPESLLADADISACEHLLDAMPFYDPGPYAEQAQPEFPYRLVTGGMRGRVFFGHDGRPNLTKLPVLRWQRGMRLINKHRTSPVALGSVSVALLHFKYHAGFARQVQLALARRSHYRDSVEYRYYKRALDRDGGLTLCDSASTRYRDTAQLVAHGLMRISPDFAALWRRRCADG
jgi:hypothetical protein